MNNSTDTLHHPTVAMIPRIADTMSFLYLDRVRITQDNTGVSARRHASTHTDVIYLPVAQIATVLLGPGVSITTRAVATIQRHGAVIAWVGDGGVRAYASTTPETKSTRWLEIQARAWADKTRRTTVVRRMFAHRFGNTVDTDGKTIEQMRGFEGSRMRQLYHTLAKEHGLNSFKRSYNPQDWTAQNPVNMALSAANTCLYGIVRAAIAAMGCSPSLGFLHSGKEGAFVYDIADLYKAELTIPLAFSLHREADPESTARRSFRERLHLFGMMPRVIDDIKYIIDPSSQRQPVQSDTTVTMLWDGTAGTLPAGRNYSPER